MKYTDCEQEHMTSTMHTHLQNLYYYTSVK